jgi:serine/threonine protein kinase
MANFLSEIKTYDAFLGYGAFGIVLKTTDSSQNASALKLIFLLHHLPPTQTEKERILTEFNITKKLKNHKNILKVINFEETCFTSKKYV